MSSGTLWAAVFFPVSNEYSVVNTKDCKGVIEQGRMVKIMYEKLYEAKILALSVNQKELDQFIDESIQEQRKLQFAAATTAGQPTGTEPAPKKQRRSSRIAMSSTNAGNTPSSVRKSPRMTRATRKTPETGGIILDEHQPTSVQRRLRKRKSTGSTVSPSLSTILIEDESTRSEVHHVDDEKKVWQMLLEMKRRVTVLETEVTTLKRKLNDMVCTNITNQTCFGVRDSTAAEHGVPKHADCTFKGEGSPAFLGESKKTDNDVSIKTESALNNKVVGAFGGDHEMLVLANEVKAESTSFHFGKPDKLAMDTAPELYNIELHYVKDCTEKIKNDEELLIIEAYPPYKDSRTTGPRHNCTVTIAEEVVASLVDTVVKNVDHPISDSRYLQNPETAQEVSKRNDIFLKNRTDISNSDDVGGSYKPNGRTMEGGCFGGSVVSSNGSVVGTAVEDANKISCATETTKSHSLGTSALINGISQ
ncbi:hypothetical protein AB6A40_005861 [Gnathostoma spinigerum]|uniref:Uncharacterized protein n=1 Tax=Gnathostoma spinigerum TaxID=75299 RepID=A0ABD6EIW2_9BILA